MITKAWASGKSSVMVRWIDARCPGGSICCNLAAAPPVVDGLCGVQRTFDVDVQEGADRLVGGGDPVEMRLRRLDRGDLLLGQPVGQVRRRQADQLGRLAHGVAHSSSRMRAKF